MDLSNKEVYDTLCKLYDKNLENFTKKEKLALSTAITVFLSLSHVQERHENVIKG